MAITTFTELSTAVGSWMARGDLASSIPDFIMIAEKEMRRRLGSIARDATTNLTTLATGLAALPADYLRATVVTCNGYPLPAASPEGLAAFRADASRPAGYWISGTSLQVWPAQICTVTLYYRQAFIAISAGNATNWILDQYPDVYLFGALREAAGFTKEADAESKWGARFEKAFQDLLSQEQLAKMSSSETRTIEHTP